MEHLPEPSTEIDLSLRSYRANFLNFLIYELPLVGVIGAIVVLGGIWGVFAYAGLTPFGLDYWLLGLTLWIGLMVPPYMMLCPERPTAESEAYGRLLNEISRHQESVK